MDRFVIRPMDSGDAASLAPLLVARRAERRLHVPLLPAGLDEPARARAALEGKIFGAIVEAPDGHVAGFLLPERKADALWGDAVVAGLDAWAFEADVDYAGVAGAYAAAFAIVAAPKDALAPALEHRILCPAFDARMLDAWFQLGFGMEQAYAVASLDSLDLSGPVLTDLDIRRARAGDEDTLAGLSGIIARAQAQAPVWAGAPPDYLAGLEKGFRALATDADAIVLLAYSGGVALGYQAWFPMEADDVDGPAPGAIELSVSGTIPEARGRGVGLALTRRGISEARAMGFATAHVDWRSTNPLAAGFWSARGFKPHAYRLVRRFSSLAMAAAVR